MLRIALVLVWQGRCSDDTDGMRSVPELIEYADWCAAQGSRTFLAYRRDFLLETAIISARLTCEGECLSSKGETYIYARFHSGVLHLDSVSEKRAPTYMKSSPGSPPDI